MKLPYQVVYFLALTLLFTPSIHANEKTKVSNIAKKIRVKVTVYSLDKSLTPDDYTKVLKTNKPELQPTMLALSGEPARISISNEKNNSISINFLSNQAATQYDLNFELANGEQKSIASVSKMKIGQSIVFSATLNNSSKLIKVNTAIENTNTVDDNGLNAIANLRQFNKLTFIMPSQQYIQTNKLYKHDKKLQRSAKRALNFESTATQNFRFAYIANNDNNRIIKGIVKIKDNNYTLQNSGEVTGSRGGKYATPTSAGKSSSKRHKDYLFEFYILPNKTAFLGQFSTNAKVNIIYARYLSVQETKELTTNTNDKN